jgi:ABC-type transport system substrate-binding protein/class 3 adenylate cyclase
VTEAGERRIVSVLITDIVDSTAIGERLGPERSKFLFDEVSLLVERQVARFGGTVAQHTGDGVLAIFGAPVAHEDDAERAVRAALAVHEELARYGHDVAEAYGVELEARSAVNTGPVVVPDAEATPDVLYNALGDTVNVAARLQPHAAAGGVAVGPLTARQIGHRFALRPLGELELKGKTAVVAAFIVAGEAEGEPAVATEIVGRDAELAALERTFDELLDGRGAVVSITGEPGIGKSRLILELRERYDTRVRFLEGHGVSYAESLPLWPIRELLRDWLGLGVTDVEARVRLELKAALAHLVGNDAAELYPFLATALGLSLEPDAAERVRELSRDTLQRRMFESVHDVMLALARERPLCLVLDDLHWADETTLELLEDLLAACDEEAVALILLYRAERDHGAWHLGERARQRYPHRHLELELRALGADESLALAVQTAGAPLPEPAVEELVARAGGNPYFLEQALRDLVERGALQRVNGSFELAVDPGELEVPAAVQEALQARLDRLAAPAREVVGVASVIGRSFGLPLLERVSTVERLPALLSELQRLDLVVEERRRPVAEYRFRHGLLQEVAYARLLEARRRELHLAVGHALEGLQPEAYGLLAYHFEEANEPEPAARYLVAAGDAARALYANDEALDHYRRALGFLDRLGDQGSARNTLLKIGLTHHLAFEFDDASQAFERAFAYRGDEFARNEPVETLDTATPGITEDVVPGRAIITWDWVVTQHLFRGLLASGPGLTVLPDLAESFSVSPDGRTYRFQLRAGLEWSDGEPLTAHDFAFTWQRMRDDGVTTAFMLDDVESAAAFNDTTLEVRLVAPRSYFLHLLSMHPFFAWPRHVVERSGPSWHRSEDLVSSGPYVLAERGAERHVLRASSTWQGSRGNVGEIRIWHAADADAVADWNAGSYDLLVVSLDAGADAPDTIAETVATLAVFYVGFCSQRSPFDDARLRRAFAHAIDRERLVAAGSRMNAPTESGGALPPAMPAHSHRGAPAHDLAEARRLLAEAGCAHGRGLEEMRLLVPSTLREPLVPDELARQWADLGARVQVERVPLPAMLDAIADRASAWIWGYAADYPDPDGLLRTLMELTPALYRDAELTGMLDHARSLTDQDERMRLYREIDMRWVGEHVALVPVSYGRVRVLRRPWVHGFHLDSLEVGGGGWADVVVRRESPP